MWGLIITGAIAAVPPFPRRCCCCATGGCGANRCRRSVRAKRTANAPAPGSVARPAISALGASERRLHSLLGVLRRGGILPADELDDLTDAASRSAATMTATAAEVVAMEETRRRPGSAVRAYLAPSIKRVECPAHQRGAAVQRDGHRRSASGVFSQCRGRRRPDLSQCDHPAALSRRVDRCDRSAAGVGAGFRRTRPTRPADRRRPLIFGQPGAASLDSPIVRKSVSAILAAILVPLSIPAAATAA